MTTDNTRRKNIPANAPRVKSGDEGRALSHNEGTKPVNPSRSKRDSGYTRVKSGEHKRRSVVRAPDMSNPDAVVMNPNVSLGSLPVSERRESALSTVLLRTEPKVRTISDTRKTAFPFSIVFLSLICTVLFMYMIFNYVQINEYTSSVSDLKNDIEVLSVEKDDLTAKLDKKNDLSYIEKVAREELGMVKIDEITKKYITMNPGDVITSFDKNSVSSSAD